ncbi:hypothetical protein HUU40_21650 [candidate division KSB1 bacterium]|nr:hypothetical protein [candidate division KSB1 bacterium]
MSQKSFPNLIQLARFPFPVYMSAGSEEHAQEIAERCERVHGFLRTTLAFEAQICILVLAPEHWQEYTGSPMYGVPQTTDARTLVVAGKDSELWQMIVPPPETLSPLAAHAMRQVYAQADGFLNVAPYMNLLAVHEIGHLYLDQATGKFDFKLPRRWLVEHYCNLCLHAYVAALEPEQLPVLETFPQTVVDVGFAHLPHHTLNKFEDLYAGMPPQNFIWYLGKLHLAAKRLHEAAGVEALQRLWKMLLSPNGNLSDGQLALRLRAEVLPEAEQVLTEWPA